MALSRFAAYVGLALDAVNAQLTSSVAVGATSLPLTNLYDTGTVLTSSGASYSAIIIDGPATETCQLSGNLSANAVPIVGHVTVNAHNAFTYVVFQLTASIGPTAYLPLESFKPSDMYEQLYDTAIVGSLVDARGAAQGIRHSTFELAGAFFADTFPYFLGGVFGSEDYTIGTPSIHAFAVNNQPATAGAQPPRILLYNYDAYNTRIFSGRFTDLSVTMDPKALLKYTAKFLGRASGVVANPTKNFTAVVPLPSWTGVATIGGTVVGKVLNADINFARSEAEAIATMDTAQDPWDVFVGAMSAKGKFGIIFDDDTQLNNYFNESQPVVDLTFTRGTGATQQVFQLHMSACNYEKADVIQQGKSYVTNEIDFVGVANATDATTAGGGISPCKVTVKNAVASGNTYTISGLGGN